MLPRTARMSVRGTSTAEMPASRRPSQEDQTTGSESSSGGSAREVLGDGAALYTECGAGYRC